jgi:hypothetical protein
MDKTEAHNILNATPVAGYSTRWDANSGQVLLQFPDKTEMAWGDAVRLGYIMFYRH